MAEPDFDVIVVGAGGAGMAAALAAAEGGASVLLVEADNKLGGSTALSGGVFYAAATSVQREAGVSDTAQAMYHYYMALNQYRLKPGLIRKFCHETGPALEWLIALGVDFPVDRLYVGGLDGVKRAHRAAGRGEEIATVLDRHVSASDHVTVAVGTRVERLIEQDGRICGIMADGGPVHAHAVVIASGGFGANPELVARHLPGTARYGDWVWYVGSPYCRGDGLRMAVPHGAALNRMTDVTTLLTPGFGRDFEPYIPGWFLFVGHEGNRFADETIDYSVSGAIVNELPAGECFAIFDEAARAGKAVGRAKGGEVYTPPSWAPDRLAQMADAGRIVRADSIDELALRMGINAAQLGSTIAEYNRGCDDGADHAFFKDPALLRPVRTAPFYAVRIRPAVIGITGGGLKIGQDADVLDEAGAPIPGLFAAGEATGGILGSCYVGGGASIANAIVFGRRAGQAAAACARTQAGRQAP